jgi:hypothetical protein
MEAGGVRGRGEAGGLEKEGGGRRREGKEGVFVCNCLFVGVACLGCR